MLKILETKYLLLTKLNFDMRKLTNFLKFGVLPLLCLALAVGCNKGPEEDSGNGGGNNLPPVEKDSTIKLSKTSVSVGLAGGSFLLEYSIENPHAGEKISAEAAEDWVNGFNYGIADVLQFKVDANETSEPRECLVTVKYRYAEDAVFVVKQGAKSTAGFTFENITTDLFSYTVDIIPDDKTAPYLIMSNPATYIYTSGLETGEDFYKDDVAYFGYFGQYYGQTAEQLMLELCNIGNTYGEVIEDCVSGMPYVLYCYYLDGESGALMSEVVMCDVVTKEPEKKPVTFTMNYEVDGTLVKASVVPEGYDGAYYFDMLNSVLADSYLEAFDFLENKPSEAVEFYWSDAIYNMSQDMAYEDIISFYDCRGVYEDGTPRSEYEFELLANHDYYLFAFAMDEHGLPGSVPQIVKVTTGDVQPSDNQITTSVTNITAQTATINFETSNNDYYIAGWEKASDWATFGNNDAERQQYLLTNRSYELISGNYSQNVIGLEPETDYVLYAFGSRGGVATTNYIATTPFKTRKVSGGLASIEIKDLGYYIASDLAEYPGWEFMSSDYYSNKVIFPQAVEITGEWSAFWVQAYIWTNREHEVYNDKQYRDGLVWHIDQYGSMSLDKTYIPFDVDGYYEIAGLVIDNYGDYSDIAKISVRTSYNGAEKDPQKFIDWWNGDDSNVGLQSLVIDDEPKQLFKEKISGKKVSERTFETREVAPEKGKIVNRH